MVSALFVPSAVRNLPNTNPVQATRISNMWACWLLNLSVRISYDDETKTVTLAADEFDSVLISDFVIRDLAPAGVVAFTDDTGEIASSRAPWNLKFTLAEVM